MCLPEWAIFFEAFWPKTSERISRLQEQMRRHQAHVTAEVQLEHIYQALSAREKSNTENERSNKVEELRLLHSLQAELDINLYDAELEEITAGCAADAGNWLLGNPDYKSWSNPRSLQIPCLWLQGIPGAGQFQSETFSNSEIYIPLTQLRENRTFRQDRPTATERWPERPIRFPDLPRAAADQYAQSPPKLDLPAVVRARQSLAGDPGSLYFSVSRLDREYRSSRGSVLRSRPGLGNDIHCH